MSSPARQDEATERTPLRGPSGSRREQMFGTPAWYGGPAASGSGSLDDAHFSRQSALWTAVTTPSMMPAVPTRGLELPKEDTEGTVEFHDWVEDSKWTYVDHDRAIRAARGTIREVWYRAQGWVAVVLIGFLVGTIGAMVHIGTLFAHGLTRGICYDAWYLPPIHCELQPHGFHRWPYLFGVTEQEHPRAYFVITTMFYIGVSCMLTCLACWLVVTVGKQAAGAGVPEIKAILGGAEIRGFASKKTLLVKWVALVGAVGGSLSIGKAAPLMHVAFCIGKNVAKLFEKYRNSMGKMREMLTSATAAGVCVAFGAPLGGVLYAFEETSTFFSPQTLYRSFVCSVVAGATLQAWDPFMQGKLTLFAINYDIMWNVWELPLFGLLGAVGGAVGHAFNILHLRVARWRKSRPAWMSNHPIVEVLLVTLLTTVLQTMFMPLGSHRTDAEYLQMLFSNCNWRSQEKLPKMPVPCLLTPDSALTLGMLKFFLTSLSFGMMVPAGLFMPNLTTGACLGWYIGLLFDQMVERNHFGIKAFDVCQEMDVTCLVPAVYSIVGAAAVMGGVNRMTLSLVVIMFELTGGFAYIIPITVGVMCSKWCSEFLGGKNSIYNMLMDHKGLPFLDPRFEGRHDVTSNAPLNSVIALDPQKVAILCERQSVAEVLTVLECDTPGFPIVRSEFDLHVLGYISKRQLTIALEDLGEQLQAYGGMAQSDVPILFVADAGGGGGVGGGGGGSASVGARTPSISTLMMTPGLGHTVRYAYDLHGYVDTSPVTVRPEVEVARVALLFRRLGLNTIIVTDSNNVLQGVLTKRDLIAHLQKDYVMQERGYHGLFPCMGGADAAKIVNETSNYPKGGFHQSEQEEETPIPDYLGQLPALPPGAQIMRKKTRAGSK